MEVKEVVPLAVEEATMESTHSTDETHFKLSAVPTPITAEFVPNKIFMFSIQFYCILLKSPFDVYDSLFDYWTIFLWRAVDNWTCYTHCDCSSLRVNVKTFMIPELQKRGILHTMIFMQDRGPLHIGSCITQLLKQHVTNEQIIGHPHFLDAPVTRPQSLWLLTVGLSQEHWSWR